MGMGRTAERTSSFSAAVALMPVRRFPPPWSAELQPNYYVVRDANKQQLAYVYFENEPGESDQPPHLLLKIKFSPSLRGLSSSDKPIVAPNCLRSISVRRPGATPVADILLGR